MNLIIAVYDCDALQSRMEISITSERDIEKILRWKVVRTVISGVMKSPYRKVEIYTKYT